MSFAYHGNWCGPGWTAGKYMSAKDATEDDFNVDPIDRQDAICKAHDYQIYVAYKYYDGDMLLQKLKEADEVFERNMRFEYGMNAQVMRVMVSLAGPSSWLAQKYDKVAETLQWADKDGRSFLILLCPKNPRKKFILEENVAIVNTMRMLNNKYKEELTILVRTVIL